MVTNATTHISERDAHGLAEKLVGFAAQLNDGERSLFWAALQGRIAPEAAEVSGYLIVVCEPLSAPQLYAQLLTPAVAGVTSP